MCTVSEMMKRFERVDVLFLAAESVDGTKDQFIEQQKDQLFAGKDSKGRDITPFYNPQTIARKKKKGQPGDRVTLKDTGAFYQGIFVDARETTVIIDSTDRKAPWLINKYGESIFGLNGVFRIGYVTELRPVFIGKIRQILRL